MFVFVFMFVLPQKAKRWGANWIFVLEWREAESNGPQSLIKPVFVAFRIVASFRADFDKNW